MLTRKPIEYIEHARSLIADPKNWQVGRLWTLKGRIGIHIQDADCFCAQGALYRALYDLDGEYNEIDRQELEAAIMSHWFGAYQYLSSVNDYTGHEAVIDLFDRAIEALNQSQS